jgi:hypothetical protein
VAITELEHELKRIYLEKTEQTVITLCSDFKACTPKRNPKAPVTDTQEPRIPGRTPRDPKRKLPGEITVQIESHRSPGTCAEPKISGNSQKRQINSGAEVNLARNLEPPNQFIVNSRDQNRATCELLKQAPDKPMKTQETFKRENPRNSWS